MSAYGLTNGGIFTVRFEAGASYTLHVGKPTPAGTDVYVQVYENPRVYLANFADVATLVYRVAKLPEATPPATLSTLAVSPSLTPSMTAAVSPVP